MSDVPERDFIAEPRGAAGVRKRLAFAAAGAVAVFGAVLVGLGVRLLLRDELPRVPWSACLPLAGLALYEAQALLWVRRAA